MAAPTPRPTRPPARRPGPPLPRQPTPPPTTSPTRPTVTDGYKVHEVVGGGVGWRGSSRPDNRHHHRQLHRPGPPSPTATRFMSVVAGIASTPPPTTTRR